MGDLIVGPWAKRAPEVIQTQSEAANDTNLISNLFDDTLPWFALVAPKEILPKNLEKEIEALRKLAATVIRCGAQFKLPEGWYFDGTKIIAKNAELIKQLNSISEIESEDDEIPDK